MLKPFIHKQFTGQIWKLAIDEAAGLLFAEIRDDERHEVFFTAFDLNSGNICFDSLSLPEKWLTGLEGCYKSILFLHGYQSAQSPIHQGIIAIDGKNGNVLWTNYVDSTHYISVNGPVVYNSKLYPQKLFLADAVTGRHVRPFDQIIDNQLENNVLLPQIINHIPYSFELSAGELRGNVHYMEHNSFRIVSLHLLNNGTLNQVLLISNNGKQVYDDLLNADIQKLQPESFIVYLNKLICIKNKTALVVLNL